MVFPCNHTGIGHKMSKSCSYNRGILYCPVVYLRENLKGAGASEAPGQTKEEFSANDTSRDPKVLKIGPQHG